MKNYSFGLKNNSQEIGDIDRFTAYTSPKQMNLTKSKRYFTLYHFFYTKTLKNQNYINNNNCLLFLLYTL